LDCGGVAERVSTTCAGPSQREVEAALGNPPAPLPEIRTTSRKARANLRGPDQESPIIRWRCSACRQRGKRAVQAPAPFFFTSPKGAFALHPRAAQPGPRRVNGCWPSGGSRAASATALKSPAKTLAICSGPWPFADRSTLRSELEMLLAESHSLRTGASAGVRRCQPARSSPWRRRPAFLLLMPHGHL